MIPAQLPLRLHRRTYEVLYDNLMSLRDDEIVWMCQTGSVKAAVQADPNRVLLSGALAWYEWKHPRALNWKPGKPRVIRLPFYVAQVLYLNLLSLNCRVGDELHLALIELDKRLTNINIHDHGQPFTMVAPNRVARR